MNQNIDGAPDHEILADRGLIDMWRLFAQCVDDTAGVPGLLESLPTAAPPDEAAVGEVVELFVTSVIDTPDATASACARLKRVIGAYPQVAALRPDFAGDWLDVWIDLGHEALNRLEDHGDPDWFPLLARMIGLLFAQQSERADLSPLLAALRYCGDAIEELAPEDPRSSGFLFLLGLCHGKIARGIGGGPPSALAADEQIKALEYARAAASQEAEERGSLLAILVELARAYRDRGHDGDDVDARRCYVAAARLTRDSWLDGNERGCEARLELADLYSSSADTRLRTVAKQLLDMLITRWAQTGREPDRLGTAYRLRAQWRLARLAAHPAHAAFDGADRAHVKLALADLDSAISVLRPTDGDQALALTGTAGYWRYVGLGERDEAHRLLTLCSAHVESVLRTERRPDEISARKTEFHAVYRALAELALAAGRREEAFRVSAQVRGMFANRLLADWDHAQGAVPDQAWAGFTAARTAYFVALSDSVDAWFGYRAQSVSSREFRSARSHVGSTRRSFEQALGQVSVLTPGDGRRLSGDPLSPAELAARLEPGHVLAVIHPLVDHTVVYLVSSEDSGRVRHLEFGPGTRDPELMQAPLRWLGAYEEIRRRGLRSQDDVAELRREHTRLRSWFAETFDMAALRDAVRGAQRLSIVAHHPLSFVPLQAIGGSDGGCLLDDVVVGFLPTVNYLRRLDGATTVTRNHRFLAVSDPRPYPPHHLSYSATETAAAASFFAEHDVLSGESANRDAVLAHTAGSDVTHLSCHGAHRYLYGSHLNSELLLAGSDTLPFADAHTYFAPHPPILVVLSACDSSAGDPRAIGDEVIGFPTAFLRAGCRAVVAALWQVEERATMFLMAAFYRNLVERSMSAGTALRQAQLWLRSARADELADVGDQLLRHAGEQAAPGLEAWVKRHRQTESSARSATVPYADPFFWGAFQLWGQP